MPVSSLNAYQVRSLLSTAEPSQIALLSVARDAEHLAVFRCGLAPLGPRRDVVPLHLRKVKQFAAIAISRSTTTLSVCTLVLLALIRRTDVSIVELPNAAMAPRAATRPRH